jgi:hypothetical protein
MPHDQQIAVPHKVWTSLLLGISEQFTPDVDLNSWILFGELITQVYR